MQVNFISVPLSGAVTFSKVVCLAWLFIIHGTMCYQVLNVLYHWDVLRYYYHSHVDFYNIPLTKIDFSFFFFLFWNTVVFCVCQESWQQVTKTQSVLAQVRRGLSRLLRWRSSGRIPSWCPPFFVVTKRSPVASGLNPAGKESSSGLTWMRPLWSYVHAWTSSYGQRFRIRQLALPRPGAFGNGRVVCARSVWEVEVVHGSAVSKTLLNRMTWAQARDDFEKESTEKREWMLCQHKQQICAILIPSVFPGGYIILSLSYQAITLGMILIWPLSFPPPPNQSPGPSAESLSLFFSSFSLDPPCSTLYKSPLKWCLQALCFQVSLLTKARVLFLKNK